VSTVDSSADREVDDGLPLSRADAWQRRHPVVGVPLAVVYKFVDDQGVYLAVIMTYYAFVSIVPVMLLATSVLGFVLDGDPELRARVLSSAVAGFPVVGDQLGRPEGLQGSVSAVVIGTVVALYGSLGLGTALQNALHVAWAVPRNSRPNPFLLRLRSLGLLVAGGLALVAVSTVSTVAQVATGLAADLGDAVRWIVLPLVSLLVVTGIVAVLVWVGVGRRHPLRAALPGAVLIATAWQGVQLGSTALVQHNLAETSSMNQTFGLVLGLVAVTYVASLALVFGVETNVVLHRHLWPRALLTPFTDAVSLTDADRRAYTGYARAQRHKGFEEVDVRFRDED
jgi:membrane protein